MPINTNIFSPVNKEITDDIKKMLRLQGHYLTGELEQSFRDIISEVNGDVRIASTANGYIEKLENGVPASMIKVDAETLNELTEYVNKRMGYGGKKAVQIAYRILQKHKREGMPTKSSAQFSRNGRRTKAVSDTFNDNQTRYGSMVDNSVVGTLDAEFHTIKSGTI